VNSLKGLFRIERSRYVLVSSTNGPRRVLPSRFQLGRQPASCNRSLLFFGVTLRDLIEMKEEGS
jgi:hypothetical protein